MRRWVLEQASPMKLHASEVRLRWTDLATADEAFMTNAVVGIVPLAVIQHGRSRLRLAERDASSELHRLLGTL
jgi:branched-subunit amino acid aminotransferase/4-amino-4-deoxychorismate lyase